MATLLPVTTPLDADGNRLIRLRDARECCDRSHKRMQIVTSVAIGILTDLKDWIGDNVKPGGPLSLRTLRQLRDAAARGDLEAGVVLPRPITLRPGRTVVPGPLPMPVYLPGVELDLALPDNWFQGQAWQIWDLLDQTLSQVEPSLQRARARAKKGTEQCTMKKALPQRNAKRVRVVDRSGQIKASLRMDRQRRRRKMLPIP